MTPSRRNEVAEELERLNGPGGILSSKSMRSTWRMYGDGVERLRLWERIIDQYLGSDDQVVSEGRLEVVTAGPPGAGKSQMTEGAAGYRNIDPDLVKLTLLRIEGAARTYDNLLRMELPDGFPVMLNELSGLVHDESWQIAEVIRDRCMQRGENVILQGTLSWSPLVEKVLDDVAAYGYEGLHIAVADVDLNTAHERALKRWWTDRCDRDQPMGGRFVPKSVIDACFDSNGSICSRNAQRLYQRVSTVLPDVTVSIGDAPLSAEWRLRVVDGAGDS